MKIDLSKAELIKYVDKQLDNFFPVECESVAVCIEPALDRLEKCFLPTANKYYRTSDGEVRFSLLHSGQYSIFLYYLSNEAYQLGKIQLASKIYYLNKALNGVDMFYEVNLPSVFDVEHPLGTVLGRASYSDCFFAFQGCTVGANKGIYPTLGKNVIMFANSTVLGDSHIGNNVVFSEGSYVKDEDIPDNCIVFGRSPELVLKKQSDEYMQNIFSKRWI